MKKFLAIIFALTFAFSLVSCDSCQNEEPGENENGEQNNGNKLPTIEIWPE